MADVHNKEIRSYNMSRIRSKNTQPEIQLRRVLHANGFRFRLHYKDLPGSPDIVLPKYRTVIFVHGCFWHNHKNCRFAKFPATNKTYWTPKLLNNIKRDDKNRLALKKAGWKVIRIWTCRLKPFYFNKTVSVLLKKLCI